MKMSTQNYINQHNPTLLQQLREIAFSDYKIERIDSRFEIEVKANDKWLRLESTFDPLRASKMMLSDHQLIDYERIIFVGLVSPSLIDAALLLNSSLRYDIVFLSMEEAKTFFEVADMQDAIFLQLDKIYILENDQAIDNTAQHLTQSMSLKTLIFEHPILCKFFDTKINTLHQYIRRSIDIRSNTLQINTLYQRQWVLNALINFDTVINSPNIFHYNEDVFKNKAIVLVAAGPSLNYELENLKRIIDEGRAYVVALGSSINTLIEANIKPHMICTYDPSTLNIKVYEKAIQLGIDDIPMVFGTTTAEDVIRSYKGPKIHYITGQDSLMQALLKDHLNPVEIIYDAPVISILAVNLFEKLQVKEIILVGQNFAFHNKEWYASGIKYDHFNFNEDQYGRAIDVLSVDHELIKTDDSLLRSLRAMESVIKANQYQNIINTTKGGAMIEGTLYQDLLTLIDTFEVNSVSKEWYLRAQKDQGDIQPLDVALQMLEDAYKELIIDIEAIRNAVLKLQEKVAARIGTEIEGAYVDFEKLLLNIEANTFYKSIMLPMDRVRRELLVQRAKQAKYLKNMAERIAFILPEYENFVAGLIFIHQQYDILFQLFFQQAKQSLKVKVNEDPNHNPS